MSAVTACDACLRRTWLVARLAGRIEIARHQRRPLREVLALSDAALLRALGGAEASAIEAEARAFDPATMRAAADAAALAIVCRHGAAYPTRLRDDRSAPAALFVTADATSGKDSSSDVRVARLTSLAERPSVAIVGTRRASDDGIEVARALGRGLAAAGVTVVSGMALGIDSAAHGGAVDGGGTTVAVLAGGADEPYPVRKRSLYERIRVAGAVISEMPPGFQPYRWCFPARNRTIAALADVTIVVEAAARSGSLITAELALELGREVGAVPGSVLSWRSDGTHALLHDGASLIRGPRDVLDLLFGVDAAAALVERRAAAPAPRPADLAPDQVRLLDAVDDGPAAVAALLADKRSGGSLRAVLTELELRGLVRRLPGGGYARVRD